MSATLGMTIGNCMPGWIYNLACSYQMVFVNGIGWNVLKLVIVGTAFLSSEKRVATHARNHPNFTLNPLPHSEAPSNKTNAKLNL